MRPPESSPFPELVDCSKVTAIALCGGKGTRMRDLTQDMYPKPLVRVGNQTLLDYSLQPLRDAGVTDIIYATAHKGEMIREHVLSMNPPPGTVFSQRQSEMEIVEAVKLGLNQYYVDAPITIFDTDAIRQGLDFADAYNFHVTTGADTTLVCTEVDQPENSNWVVIDDANGETGCIVLSPKDLKPSSNIIKCGMVICSKQATRFIRNSNDDNVSWIDLVTDLGSFGRMRTYVTPEPLIYSNINTPADVSEIEKRLKLYSE